MKHMVLASMVSAVVGVAASGSLADAQPRPAVSASDHAPRRLASDAVRVGAKPPTIRAKALRTGTRPRSNVVVYLNRNGVTLSPGWDDSAANVSGLVERRTAIPAYRGSDRGWGKLVRCVQDRFAEFAIDVVDQRPANGEYIMAMIGGESSLLGYQDNVSGVAPSSGDVMRSAVAFVFAETIEQDADQTCVTSVHEVGHALGLDHQYLCSDPMTYLSGCSDKTFQDIDAPCGEEEARECDNGNATQNSWQYLARAVGLRREDVDGELADPVVALPPAGDPIPAPVPAPSDDAYGTEPCQPPMVEVTQDDIAQLDALFDELDATFGDDLDAFWAELQAAWDAE